MLEQLPLTRPKLLYRLLLFMKKNLKAMYYQTGLTPASGSFRGPSGEKPQGGSGGLGRWDGGYGDTGSLRIFGRELLAKRQGSYFNILTTPSSPGALQ